MEGIDPEKLRRFFLSLLWRAAATSLADFDEIHLPEDDLEQLREMVCTGRTTPLAFYPAQLTQLSTIGLIHNHGPIADTKLVPTLDEPGSPRDLPIIRFYFDGLITHIHRHRADDGLTASVGSLIVGAEDTLILSTQTYEDSWQRLNLERVATEVKPESRGEETAR